MSGQMDSEALVEDAHEWTVAAHPPHALNALGGGYKATLSGSG